jgi:hypothetical protein
LSTGILLADPVFAPGVVGFAGEGRAPLADVGFEGVVASFAVDFVAAAEVGLLGVPAGVFAPCVAGLVGVVVVEDGCFLSGVAVLSVAVAVAVLVGVLAWSEAMSSFCELERRPEEKVGVVVCSRDFLLGDFCGVLSPKAGDAVDSLEL